MFPRQIPRTCKRIESNLFRCPLSRRRPRRCTANCDAGAWSRGASVPLLSHLTFSGKLKWFGVAIRRHSSSSCHVALGSPFFSSTTTSVASPFLAIARAPTTNLPIRTFLDLFPPATTATQLATYHPQISTPLACIPSFCNPIVLNMLSVAAWVFTFKLLSLMLLPYTGSRPSRFKPGESHARGSEGCRYLSWSHTVRFRVVDSWMVGVRLTTWALGVRLPAEYLGHD